MGFFLLIGFVYQLNIPLYFYNVFIMRKLGYIVRMELDEFERVHDLNNQNL